MGLMEKKKFKLLIVDDEPALRDQVITALGGANYRFEEAENGKEAIKKVHSEYFDVVLLDVQMPGGINGLQVLREIKKYDSRIIVIMITAYSSVKDAVEAIREGAYNYIEKPVNDWEVVKIVEKSLEAHSLIDKVADSAPVLRIDGDHNMVSHSTKMKRIFSIIEKLSKVDTSVLIRGENGTGKELVARAIHSNSLRKNGQFVAVNCGAIPENLMESEFFGHEKGAFTGADRRTIGKIQYASGGTLFLDEIGELPLLMQVKLLRVLQEKTFIPVGSNREIKADVRIVAATNQDLDKMIEEGTFREDLFYRLNVLPVYLPPLRERKEDIPVLVDKFIEKANEDQNRQIKGVSEEVMSVLWAYSWPGNIRELENVIELAFVLENSEFIQKSSLPEHLHEIKEEPEKSEPGKLDFIHDRENFEKEFIIKVLKKFGGRVNKTVQNTNIPKNTLLRKMKKYNINPKDYE